MYTGFGNLKFVLVETNLVASLAMKLRDGPFSVYSVALLHLDDVIFLLGRWRTPSNCAGIARTATGLQEKNRSRRRDDISACSFGWWLMTGADLL
jgi:hypothetical protein